MNPRLRILLALLATIGSGALFFSHSLPGLHGDAAAHVQLWDEGVWVYAHAFLMPFARLVAWAALPFATLEPEACLRIVSAISAAILCGLTTWIALAIRPAWAAIAAVVLAVLAPAWRFHAAVSEVHGYAAAFVAFAVVLAMAPADSSRRALARACVGYALASTAHLSGLVMGPTLWLLHLRAENLAGRPTNAREALGRGLVLATCALLSVAMLWLLDAIVSPRNPGSHTFLQEYVETLFGWEETGLAKVDRGFVALQILAPLGALVPVAIAGIVLELRRAPVLGLALALWIAGFVFCSLGAGVRDYGSYLVSAMPALVLASAAAIAALHRRRDVLAGALIALAACACWAGITRWFDTSPLVRTLGRGEEVPMSFLAPVPLESAWRYVPTALSAEVLWLASGILAALGGVQLARRQAREQARAVFAVLAATVPLVLLAAQATLSEGFRRFWPDLGAYRIDRYGREARAALGPNDVLATVAFGPEWHQSLRHVLRRPFVDLWEMDDPNAAGVGALRAREIEKIVAATHALGGTVLVGEDALGVLVAARRRRALTLVKRWLAEGQAVRWQPHERLGYLRPAQWADEIRLFARRARERVGEKDLLLVAFDPVELRWSAENLLDVPWLDLWQADVDGADPDWEPAARERVERVRAEGGKIVLSDDGVGILWGRRRERALAWLREQVPAGAIERLAPVHAPYGQLADRFWEGR